jgi:hypothetical protein
MLYFLWFIVNTRWVIGASGKNPRVFHNSLTKLIASCRIRYTSPCAWKALKYNYAIILWVNTSNTLDIYILYFQELSWFLCHSCFFFLKNHSESCCCLAWNHCCRWVYIIFRNVETMKWINIVRWNIYKDKLNPIS